MSRLFLTLLNMSITASWLVPAILLLRALFRRAPRSFWVVMWSFVGIRLVIPFSFESVLSLIPDSDPIPPELVYSGFPAAEGGLSTGAGR